MNNHKHDAPERQITDREFFPFESFLAQAELSNYAFVQGALIHWPSAVVLDLRQDFIVVDESHDYSELLNEVRRYRRRLERIRPGKTDAERKAIISCAAIQRTFGFSNCFATEGKCDEMGTH